MNMMNVFLARQPILDKNHRIRAYEIFYRSGFTNHYTGTDEDEASSKVIVDTFQNLGLESLTTGKPAFINFSTRLLQKQVATLFPKKQLVIEVLETVGRSDEIVEKCRELKSAGYTIVLDDFVYSKDREVFLDLADIVKVDLMTTDRRRLPELLRLLRERNLTLLAEKVETWEDFQMATELGFTLFQGYYFSRPEIVTAKRLTPMQLNCFELISEANHGELDLDQLSERISGDLSLTYSLIRLANSAAFARRHPVRTVKQALVLLGEREIRKWVTLIALQRMSITQPEAPVTTSLVRGRFAGLLAEKTRWKEQKDTLFLAGLFSLLDVLLQRPLSLILEEVQAPFHVQELLLYGRGHFRDLGGLVLSYEQGRWDDVEIIAKKLEIDVAEVTRSYLDALHWCPGDFE